MYVERNTEARSGNRCCHAAALSYMFWVCVYSLSYPACSAHASHYVVICVLFGSTIFFHIISQTARFLEKGVTEYKTRVLIFSTTFLCNISRSTKNSEQYQKLYIGLYVKYPLFLSGCTETRIFSTN